jgi:non-specific serine/threonine protein kinase
MEIEELTRLMSRTRLLTITGAGGSGKTRLALEVATAVSDAYPDGSYFVDLSSISDPALVPQAVAAVLGIREQADQFLVTALAEYLRSRRLLLILDNCEHLLGACASISYTLLSASVGLRMLATSRQSLDVAGELVWRLVGLPVPQESTADPEILRQYESVQLFVERASFKLPGFTLNEETAAAITHVCAQTDGLPLAIEMAASRVRMMSVEEIVQRLNRSLRLLTGYASPALPRHRTLEAAIEWSYRLLTAEEQHLLRTLSIFAGSFAPEAAHAIFAAGTDSLSNDSVDLEDTLELLTSLIDKSLVNVEKRAQQTRYRLPETIRQYSATKAYAHNETVELATRHFLFYLSLAKSAELALQGPEQRAWLDRLDLEHDNLRKALSWTQTEDARKVQPGEISPASACLQLVSSLWRFWYVRGHLSEGRMWSEAVLALASSDTEVPTALRAGVLAGTGLLANDQGDYPAASRLLNESLALFRAIGDKQGISNCLNYLGVLARNLGDLREAIRLCEESLSLQRELGSKPGMAACLNNLGYLAINIGDYTSARAFVEESLVFLKELADPMRTAIALNNLGRIACARGDYATAERVLLESLSLRRKLLDTKGIPNALSALGIVALNTTRYDEAHADLQLSMEQYRALDDREGVAFVLNSLGELARYLGRHNEAWENFEQALVLAREIGNRVLTSSVLINIGRAWATRGDHIRAAASLTEALQLCLHTGGRVSTAYCLAYIAFLFNEVGELACATRLVSYAMYLIESSGFTLHPSEQEELDRLMNALRAKVGKKSWGADWKSGREMSLDAVAGEALSVVDVVQQHSGTPAHTATPGRARPIADLTRREIEVLRLLAEGLTDAQIAGKLFLSPHTVHAHLHSVYSKLDVTTRSAAVRFAIQNDLA